MQNFVAQYKVVFFITWIVFYLIYPSWIGKHTILGLASYPFARSLVIFGLLMYFYLSAKVMSRTFRGVIIDKPVIYKFNNWLEYLRNNIWLAAVCFLSLLLHLHMFSFVTILGELPFLERPLWMYDVIDGYWHKLSDFPIQIFFWGSFFLIFLISKQKRMINYTIETIAAYKTNIIIQLLVICFMFVLLSLYSHKFPYYFYPDTYKLIRYTPAPHILYLLTFFAFGTSHIGPRIVQFIFYILSALYLYRTINLFKEKETALLGAAIYLFSPIIFSYASQAAVETGAVLFIILVSFYFLRFLKGGDIRDIILATFLIGTGFLYKEGLMIMFFVCFGHLLISRAIKRNFKPIVHFKILLFSWVPILPWMKVGHGNPIEWSHLFTLDGLSIVLLMIQSQLSLIIFLLLLFSFVFIFYTKRDDLSLFFGLLFIAYYVLFTLMRFGEWNHRYMMHLYPAIAVFLSLMVRDLAQRVRWKYAFKLFSFFLISYLIVISLIPRSSSNITTWKYRDFETQYFPIDKATDWIRNETEKNERILVLYMIPYKLYLERSYPDRKEIDQKKFVFRDPGSDVKKIIYPIRNLKIYCNENNINYIMFPFGPRNLLPDAPPLIETMEMTKYLYENMNDEFIRVARFNLDDNFLSIYKVKK